MTPGNTDLLCRCGKQSARFHEGKATKGQKVTHWIADCTTQLYPWIADCTTLRGAIHLMRSDGCAGQMKSGRHFRFISNFHTFLWVLAMRLIWTHFESCHGKDLSVTNNADKC